MTRQSHVFTMGLVALLAGATASWALPTPIRILTYNTALMNLKMDVYAALPYPPVIPVSYDSNGSDFGGQSYAKRIELMADAIKDEDPDVVVLNEMWNPSDRDTFIQELAVKGPYKSYVKTIKGKPPGLANPFGVPGVSSLIEFAANFLGFPGGSAALSVVAGFVAPLIGLPPVAILNIDVKYQDSGLMLFSKKPFVAFDNPLVPFNPATVLIEGSNAGVPWGGGFGQVAAKVYTGARGMDQLASKAVGMVRVLQAPNAIVDVAFSHTNADESGIPVGDDVRAAQMAEMKDLILASLFPAELRSDQVFVLGDLNTPGSNKAIGTTDEWTTLYGKNAASSPFAKNPGVFFACGDGPCTGTPANGFNPNGTFFTETWGFETSVKDRSATNYFDQKYYDYVLHTRPNRQCVQYIRIGSEMQDDVSGSQLSDHLPVHVDVNMVAPQCSPNEADANGPKIVTLDQKTTGATYNVNSGARITHPGGMQWYKLPTAGTYWINLTNNSSFVGFDVYRDTNLSDPIQPYHGEQDSHKGFRFVTDSPLYVRVYARQPNGTPNRTWTGDYSITFRKAMGATPDDSIAIQPADTLTYEWTPTFPDQSVVWFDIYTNQVGKSGFATSDLVNESYQGGVVDKGSFVNGLYELVGGNPYSMNSYKALKLKPAKNWKDPNQGNFVSGYSVQFPDLKGTPTGGSFDPRKYFFRLEKDNFTLGSPAIGLTTHLTFLTDLMYLSPNFVTDMVPLTGSPEFVGLGVRFDKKGQLSCGMGGQACSWIQVAKKGTSTIPAIKPLQGPFRKEGRPTAWVAEDLNDTPEAIGLDYNGSQIFPIGITRQEPGTPTACVNGDLKNRDQCWKMYMSRPYGDDYDYLLEYGITHDVP